MFNNAYKDNFAVFAIIFGNLFPQKNIGLNPIICDMFLHFNILATAKFTGISVYYFHWQVSTYIIRSIFKRKKPRLIFLTLLKVENYIRCKLYSVRESSAKNICGIIWY